MNVTPIKVRIVGKHTSALHSQSQFLFLIIDIYQLDFEDQSGVCWDDRWESTGSICLQMRQVVSCISQCKVTYVVRRHRKPSFLTKRELGNP